VSIGSIQLRGDVTLRHVRWDVWSALSDPNVLSQCIAGCESVEHIASNMLFVRLARTSTDRDGLGRRALVEIIHAVPPDRMRVRIRSATRAGSFEANVAITLQDKRDFTVAFYDGDISGPAAADSNESAMRAASRLVADRFSAGLTSAMDRFR
jgi:carbon monoxide dehydrogenase subunit G